MVCAEAHTAEDAKNHTRAMSTMILRPQMSESFAQMTPEAALARRKAPPIHVYPAAELRSLDMVGAAVDTIVTSSAATNKESYHRVSFLIQYNILY